jgi:hypothetical protein
MKDDMDGICSTHVGNEKYKYNFGWETLPKGLTRRDRHRWEYNIKTDLR